MKILKYENRKIDAIFWDISTPEKEKAAFLELFEILDKNWQCYAGLEEYVKELAEIEKALKLMKGLKEELLKKATEENVKELERRKEAIKDAEIQLRLLQNARAGNADAAVELMSIRKDYEYEQWETYMVKDPLKED